MEKELESHICLYSNHHFKRREEAAALSETELHGPVCLLNGLQVQRGCPGPGLSLQTEASHGCLGSRQKQGAPRGVLWEAGEEAALLGSNRPADEPMLSTHPSVSCSEPAFTAGTRGRSCWLSSSPDASLSGRCSPRALLFCPVQSEAENKGESQQALIPTPLKIIMMTQTHQDPENIHRPTGVYMYIS